MPTFFLHHLLDGARLEDRDGHDLRDSAEAKREAVLGIRSVQGNRLLSGLPLMAGHVEIASEDGQVLCRLCYIEALGPVLDEDPAPP